MNSEMFLQEVLKSEICPEGFSQIYAQFRRYQEEALRTLREFHRICEKNHVDYQLAYGSLLGAIRDGGQIPWDYDVDVIIPYEQKDKLVAALKQDLGEDFYFYCPDVDPKCRHFIIRVTPKEYRSEELHVDVFYCIGLPEEQDRHQKYKNDVCQQVLDRFLILVKAWEESHGNLKQFARYIYNKIKLLKTPLSKINKKHDFLCNQYPLNQASQCMIVATNAVISPTAELWDTMLLQTQEGEFRITKNYEQILQMMYGDYKKIYPLENRLNEMMGHYRHLTKYGLKRKR